MANFTAEPVPFEDERGLFTGVNNTKRRPGVWKQYFSFTRTFASIVFILRIYGGLFYCIRCWPTNSFNVCDKTDPYWYAKGTALVSLLPGIARRIQYPSNSLKTKTTKLKLWLKELKNTPFGLPVLMQLCFVNRILALFHHCLSKVQVISDSWEMLKSTFSVPLHSLYDTADLIQWCNSIRPGHMEQTHLKPDPPSSSTGKDETLCKVALPTLWLIWGPPF